MDKHVEKEIVLKNNLATVYGTILELNNTVNVLLHNIRKLMVHYIQIHYLLNAEKYREILDVANRLGATRLDVYVIAFNTVHFVFLSPDRDIDTIIRINKKIQKYIDKLGLGFKVVIDVYDEHTYNSEELSKYEDPVFILEK